ncbi:hypothetical protein V5799_015346, partial [Amblyomma americanum]
HDKYLCPVCKAEFACLKSPAPRAGAWLCGETQHDSVLFHCRISSLEGKD